MKVKFLIPGTFAIAAAAIAFAMPKRYADEMPQYAGEDLFSLLFSDARALLGDSFIKVSDRYYHGGIDISYTLPDHTDKFCEGNDHDTGDHNGDGHTHHLDQPDSPRHKSGSSNFPDPWAWLNARIHVQELRHLEGSELVEIVPWIWAAIKADPHNIDAYETGWYVMAKMQKRPEDGMKILEDGIKNNPESISLEVTRGQSLIGDMKDNVASEAAFLLAREKALKKCGGQPDNLSEEDVLLLRRALSYLIHFASERGDKDVEIQYKTESGTIRSE